MFVRSTNTVSGFYGGSKTPCKVFVAYCYCSSGLTWYVVKGSVNVNATYDDIENGVNVETLSDVDTFTNDKPINTEKQLIKALES